MGKTLKSLFAVAALFAGASAAQASPQEDEGNFYVARGVVSGVLADHQYLGESYYQKVDSIGNANGNANWTIHPPLITRSEASGDCIDHVWLGAMTVDVTMGSQHREDVVVLNPTDFDLDWSDLASVRADGGDVKILWKGRSSESTILYGTEEAAGIVARNIEIVRRQCLLEQ